MLEHTPNANGVLGTAGAQGSAYAFKGAGGKIDLTGRVPVLKVRSALLNVAGGCGAFANPTTGPHLERQGDTGKGCTYLWCRSRVGAKTAHASEHA